METPEPTLQTIIAMLQSDTEDEFDEIMSLAPNPPVSQDEINADLVPHFLLGDEVDISFSFNHAFAGASGIVKAMCEKTTLKGNKTTICKFVQIDNIRVAGRFYHCADTVVSVPLQFLSPKQTLSRTRGVHVHK